MGYKGKLGWADVTPAKDYLNRRQIMAGAAGLGLGTHCRTADRRQRRSRADQL